MSKNVNIKVKHLTRVEGHGNIVVNATEGKVEQVEWQVPEAPRFFEAMVRGQSYQDIQIIVSRICGICSISHSLVATRAVENAMGIKTSEQTDKIRMLMHFSEQMQSHVLHVGYLVAPDLFNAPSVVPLIPKATDAVKTIIKAHRVANEWSELIGGRITHPVTLMPGGMTKLPTAQQLKDLKGTLEKTKKDVVAIAEVVLSVAGNLPAFERDTEYVSLKLKDEDAFYTYYFGDIASTDGEILSVEKWHDATNEYVSDQSTAKWAKWHRNEYAVGALARFNNNAEFLSGDAKGAAKMFGLEKGCCNPYMNSVAQLVECVDIIDSSLRFIDELLTAGLKDEKISIDIKAGKGCAAIEAPRGILFHEYEFDSNGRCTAADLCIPTNQNHGNIQADFEKIVPEILDEGEDAVRQKLEMLVRAYDPCISCSTHMLNVEFLK
jgi:coenzyme F420-reducing hydrogenase alpha subunit